MASLLAPIRNFIDGLVHHTAQQDARAAAKHRAFIAPRLFAGAFAFACLPVYVALRGAPGGAELAVFAAMLVPLAVAGFLSHTGRYDSALLLSSLALTLMIVLLALATGGLFSFAALWLAFVPLEAALSGSRRAATAACALVLAGAAVLLAATLGGLAASATPGPLGALAGLAAMLYAGSLALGATARSRDSENLHAAEEERYRLLARNMTDVITRHGRNGAVLFASPAAESLFGAGPRALLGHGLFDHVHIADRPAYLTALGDAAAHGEPRSVEFRVRRNADAAPFGGQFVWVEMRCRPVDGVAASEDTEVVAVTRDISERKGQESALESARAEAERADAAKSRFLATMSHELRTPLNAIIGFSDMLTQEDAMRLDSSKRREYAHLINESGHHLLSVVNDILDMSKMESGSFEITPELFTPGAVVESCCDILALKARDHGIELDIGVPADMPQIVADKRSLNQIMFNLVSNAIKFSDRGGRVSVRAGIEAGRFVLTVADTGIGIGENDLQRIGEPFFQARSSYDRRHDGTGLGLSIVKGLVGLHGGEVEIRSRMGEGTRVTIRLPLDCQRHPRSARGGMALFPLSVRGAERPHETDRKLKKSA